MATSPPISFQSCLAIFKSRIVPGPGEPEPEGTQGLCLLPCSHGTQLACHPLDLKIPHLLRLRRCSPSGGIQPEEMEQTVAGKAGRAFARAVIPSCAERGPWSGLSQLAEGYPWHREAVQADTPPVHQAPTSAALLQHTLPGLPKVPRTTSLTWALNSAPSRVKLFPDSCSHCNPHHSLSSLKCACFQRWEWKGRVHGWGNSDAGEMKAFISSSLESGELLPKELKNMTKAL